jgi:hypothetical protein
VGLNLSWMGLSVALLVIQPLLTVGEAASRLLYSDGCLQPSVQLGGPMHGRVVYGGWPSRRPVQA